MLVPPASTHTLCSSVSPQHPSRLHFCLFDLGRLLLSYPYKHWQCSPFPFSLPPPHPSVPFAGAFSVAALGIVGNIGVPSRAAFCALPTQWGSVAVGCQAGVVVHIHEGPSANRACFPHVLWGPEHPDGPGEGTKCPLAVLPTEGRCIPGVEAQLVAPGGSGDTLLMSPALHPSACALHSSHRSSPWSCLFP